ncbi:hypothetical protein CROQUDRAFT_656019 [Cronartium quercuum f. sp. fusiforme G11]|uniref:Uncharacterized protein n=1 Tax=Cronartium quercuum f. sp. fusiforme G11 TaxID=708437 RepID=A0A9P6NP32_9BASI|nr:hypothetical protein CROQUDRAFT_656019 [Cronartium quercuum f. sp. fusiforme G11]
MAPFKTQDKKITDTLDDLEKGQASVITCKITETPTQFLAYCGKYTEQRREFRKKLKQEKIRVEADLLRRSLSGGAFVETFDSGVFDRGGVRCTTIHDRFFQ